MTVNHARRKWLLLGIGATLTSPKIFAAQKIPAVELTSNSQQVNVSLPISGEHSRVFTMENPHRVIIDIPMQSFPPSLTHSLVVIRQKFPWITQAKIAHFTPQTARIVLQVTAKPQIKQQRAAGRLTASITVAGAAAISAVPAVVTSGVEHAQPAKKNLLVMIDPGHGGKDPGAIGNKGTYEKHVVLSIAQHLQHQLRTRHGIHAVLTRQDDVFIPLYHRVSLAHQHEADLFLSIHADGFTNDQVSGASVFALSEHGAGSAMARYLSQSENSVDAIYDNDVHTQDAYLKQTLFDLDQTETINRSLHFGNHLASNIIRVHHMHNKHTEQAGFAVLKSPRIPSVLVETSFITNHQEEQLLGKPEFQLKMANALADGINTYLNEERKEKLLG